MTLTSVVGCPCRKPCPAWQSIENRTMIVCNEGSLQAHWLDGCGSDPVAMRTLLRNVRSKEQSGKHMLPSGFSGFDSKRASGLGAVAIATIKSVPLGKV